MRPHVGGILRAPARPDMCTRRLILVIAVYVGLDLTNPFMPGAFIFDPEQSVEGVQGERGRAQQRVVLALPATPPVPPAAPP
ncbi:MAG TPA: hypothetical protein VLK35_05770, partial [Methylomirabilota bacterium]|nr:hypothetical protein [Methylomirabilota bacterium]